DLPLKKRGAHPLAFAGDLALQQGDEDAERAENSRAEIRDRNPGAHRALPRQAGDPHQPAHALRNLIEARPLAIRAVLAEAGDAGVDETPVERLEALVIDAEAEFHVGPVILDHDVRGPDHLAENVDAFRLLEVERDAALVAVQVLEIRAVARAAHIAALPPLGQLDLDDVGAPVRELAHAGR